MSIQYSAQTTTGLYTITRDIAGGAFTARHNGEAIAPAGRLRSARAACFRHNGGSLDWVDEAQLRALQWSALEKIHAAALAADA